jgi:glycerol-3-phosphate acyltransferase PlsX
MISVALDAMGGDNAPDEMVQGALKAAKTGEFKIALVGDSKRIDKLLQKEQGNALPIEVVPSEGVILEGDSPIESLRSKPRASISVCIGLLRHQKVDGVITMGSTGGAMAASVFQLGLMDGVERPAIGGEIIGFSPRTTLIDLGSNVDCRPIHLLNFAVMGSVFANARWAIDNPEVGILSIGAEEGKGNKLVKEAITKLEESTQINFIGNVEPNELLDTRANVVVCDGFIGNVILKLTEGLGLAICKHIEDHYKPLIEDRILNQLKEDIFQRTNVVETFGGGPILGVKGLVVVGHGNASANAVAKAFETVKWMADSKYTDKLQLELTKVSNE